MTKIELPAETQQRESIIKDVLNSFIFMNGEYWETDEAREIVERAFDLVCRNRPSRLTKDTTRRGHYLYQETLRYIRIGYPYLKNWC